MVAPATAAAVVCVNDVGVLVAAVAGIVDGMLAVVVVADAGIGSEYVEG